MNLDNYMYINYAVLFDATPHQILYIIESHNKKAVSFMLQPSQAILPLLCLLAWGEMQERQEWKGGIKETYVNIELQLGMLKGSSLQYNPSYDEHTLEPHGDKRTFDQFHIVLSRTIYR